MLKNVNGSFIKLTLVIFLALLFPFILQEGLFMDGLMYSTISHNLANGIGTYWYPSYSETIYPVFNEHPPLGFILQSFFFQVLGDGFYIEKIYSFFTAILTAFFMVKLWKHFAYSKRIKT